MIGCKSVAKLSYRETLWGLQNVARHI